MPPHRLTQHKRFAIAHPNFCFAKTSFMPGTLCGKPKQKSIMFIQATIERMVLPRWNEELKDIGQRIKPSRIRVTQPALLSP